jgi:hypothetical protein
MNESERNGFSLNKSRLQISEESVPRETACDHHSRKDRAHLIMIEHVENPRCGWSGKPAAASCAGHLSSSSRRNGSRFFNDAVPTCSIN